MDMMTSEVSRRSMLGLFSLAAALPLVGCASVPRAAESAPAWRTKSVRSQTDGLNIVYHEAGRGKPLVIVHGGGSNAERSEEHTSELQSLMRISYAVFCLKKKTNSPKESYTHTHK